MRVDDQERFELTESGFEQGLWFLADMINDGHDPGDHDERDAWAIRERNVIEFPIEAVDVSLLICMVWRGIRDAVNGPDASFASHMALEMGVDEQTLRFLASRPASRPRRHPSPFDRPDPFAQLQHARCTPRRKL